MAKDSNLPYQDPSTINRRLDAESFTIDSEERLRERMLITGIDGTVAAKVMQSDPANTDPGMVVRDVHSSLLATPIIVDGVSMSTFSGIVAAWEDDDEVGRIVTKGTPMPVQMRFSDGTPVNQSGGNMLVNVQNFAIDTFGDDDSVASTLTSGWMFAQLFGYDSLSNVARRLNLGTGVETGALRVVHASDVASSVVVNEIFGTTGANLINPDGRMKVELPTGSSGLTDTELRAAGVPVHQVSGSNWSTKVTGFDSSLGASLLNGDGNAYDARDRNWSITESIEVKQVSGTEFSTIINATLVALDIKQVSGSEFSTVINSSLVAFEVKQVSGFTDSVFITGQADSLLTYQARTTNPTAVSDGADVRPKADDLGRVITRPMQVRDLITTAYATLNSNAETNILAAAAGFFLDPIMIKFSNTSSLAVVIDIRAVSGGNIIDTISIPAGATQGWSLGVPYPQSDTGNAWTMDFNSTAMGSDVSGTTVYAAGLFSKEV